MDEGVEAGEDQQRHHGAQRHHVVELDSRILRVSDEAASVMLAVWLRDRSWSFSLLVKYWAQRKTHD